MLTTPLLLALAALSAPTAPTGTASPGASSVAGVPKAAARGVASGPGRLLARPLVYRGRPKDGRLDRYIVFFRVRGPFAGTDDVGTTHPGAIRVEDAFDNHDGYGGAVSVGRPRGKCYTWHLGTDQSTPGLDAKRIGARVAYRFALRRSRVQTGAVTLRLRPSASRLARDRRSIGC